MPRPQQSPAFIALAVAALLALGAGPARAQATPDCDPKVSPGCDQAPEQPAPPAYPAYPAYPYPTYQPGQSWAPPPAPSAPWHMEMRPRWGLFAGGLAMFGSVYTMGLFAAIRDPVMAIPVIGPFIEIANYRQRFDCPEPPLGSVYYCKQERSSDNALYAILILDGFIQAGGIAMAAAGLFTRREVRVYDVKMTVLPSVSPYGGGISAFGTF